MLRNMLILLRGLISFCTDHMVLSTLKTFIIRIENSILIDPVVNYIRNYRNSSQTPFEIKTLILKPEKIYLYFVASSLTPFVIQAERIACVMLKMRLSSALTYAVLNELRCL